MLDFKQHLKEEPFRGFWCEIFFSLDGLPVAQPTVSKHQRKFTYLEMMMEIIAKKWQQYVYSSTDVLQTNSERVRLVLYVLKERPCLIISLRNLAVNSGCACRWAHQRPQRQAVKRFSRKVR